MAAAHSRATALPWSCHEPYVAPHLHNLWGCRTGRGLMFQAFDASAPAAGLWRAALAPSADDGPDDDAVPAQRLRCIFTVSYTHLTLPTILLV